MSKAKVVILATEGVTTNLLYNGLSSDFDVVKVIIESRQSKVQLFKKRVKRLGLMKVLGQAAFLLIVRPFIPSRQKRIKAILNEKKVSDSEIPSSKIKKVENVHDLHSLHQIQADFIVINGTRILKKDLIQSAPCPIVNIHVGITPKYRGVHGGYWALRNQEPELFGVTLHFVDAGIDTGNVIAQKVCQPTAQDNFKTYPILQYASGVQLLLKHGHSIVSGTVESKAPMSNESQLWYHPTIWEYLVAP